MIYVKMSWEARWQGEMSTETIPNKDDIVISYISKKIWFLFIVLISQSKIKSKMRDTFEAKSNRSVIVMLSVLKAERCKTLQRNKGKTLIHNMIGTTYYSQQQC